MYAIVKRGGKQYRVERGQTLLVERLPRRRAERALEPILYRSDETVFDKDGLKHVKVTARVLGHERGEKLSVFKFKPKRGYKRRTGHRQELTRIEVTDISMGAAAKAGASKAATKPTSDESPRPRPKPPAAKAGARKPNLRRKQTREAATKPAKVSPESRKETTENGS